MRFSMSTWNYLKTLDRQADMAEAIGEIKGQGFGIELWLDWHAEPGLVDRTNWERLAGLCRGASDLSAHSRLIHTFDPAVLREEIDLCKRLGADPLVVHPRSLNLEAGTWDASATLDRSPDALRTVRGLLDYAGDASVRLALENGPMDLLREVLEVFGEHHALGICVDTGHANLHRDLYDEPSVAFLEQFADSLIHLHLSDNDGSGDQHRAPGGGTIDWRSVAATLDGTGYRGPVVFELNEPGPAQAGLSAVEFARRVFED